MEYHLIWESINKQQLSVWLIKITLHRISSCFYIFNQPNESKQIPYIHPMDLFVLDLYFNIELLNNTSYCCLVNKHFPFPACSRCLTPTRSLQDASDQSCAGINLLRQFLLSADTAHANVLLKPQEFQLKCSHVWVSRLLWDCRLSCYRACQVFSYEALLYFWTPKHIT